MESEQETEDYLAAFAGFVNDNPEKIESIESLLKQPQRWNKFALQDLREKLKSTRYAEENLQRAYKLLFKKDVDIISMIKHAANEQAPLYTAVERVTNALNQVTAGKRFTGDQKIWLDKIREHLIANLSIEIEDFQSASIFTESGGWPVANHKFGHRLNDILRELNAAIAT